MKQTFLKHLKLFEPVLWLTHIEDIFFLFYLDAWRSRTENVYRGTYLIFAEPYIYILVIEEKERHF